MSLCGQLEGEGKGEGDESKGWRRAFEVMRTP